MVCLFRRYRVRTSDLLLVRKADAVPAGSHHALSAYQASLVAKRVPRFPAISRLVSPSRYPSDPAAGGNLPS